MKISSSCPRPGGIILLEFSTTIWLYSEEWMTFSSLWTTSSLLTLSSENGLEFTTYLRKSTKLSLIRKKYYHRYTGVREWWWFITKGTSRIFRVSIRYLRLSGRKLRRCCSSRASIFSAVFLTMETSLISFTFSWLCPLFQVTAWRKTLTLLNGFLLMTYLPINNHKERHRKEDTITECRKSATTW